MHYYQFNIGDYASHTQHLDPLEDIAFRRMLDWMYLNESPLPEDVNEIARIIRMRPHSECIATVLQDFFVLHEDGYHNARADAEITAYHAKSERAKKSAEARWSKNKEKSDANALQAQSERNAKHKTLNTKHKTLNKGSRLPDDWQLPRDWGYWVIDEYDWTVDQIKLEADKFRDYWISVAGAKGVKKDWQATWRNWIRRENESRPKNKANCGNSLVTQEQDFITVNTSTSWAEGLT